MRKNVVLVGTFDTKGIEYKYVMGLFEELGIHVRDRKDRLLLLHILNKTLEDRIGCALYERLDPGQQAHLVHIRQQEELKQWFADNFPDYAEVVDCCIRTLLEELIEDSS